jgi:alpha-beta hydrolase superfamily lysophospholipase
MTSRRKAADGTHLATRSWDPEGSPRSVVMIVHGLGEHSGRYRHVAKLLTDRGHAVRAADLRGHGESEGRRAHLESWDHYLDDVAADLVIHRKPGVPLVLLGHSLGGLVALSYALSERPDPDLLVLSAPALDADLPKYKKVAARLLGRLVPKASLPTGLRGDQLSRDPAVGERYFADPLVHTRTALSLGRQALLAGERCRANLGALRVPTLVLHGGADTIVPPSISAPLAAVAGVERHVLAEFRHEIFNEEHGGPATNRVADWIESRG